MRDREIMTHCSSRSGSTSEPLLILAFHMILVALLIPQVLSLKVWPFPTILVSGLATVYALRAFWPSDGSTKWLIPTSVWAYFVLSALTVGLFTVTIAAIALFAVLPLIALRIEVFFIRRKDRSSRKETSEPAVPDAPTPAENDSKDQEA